MKGKQQSEVAAIDPFDLAQGRLSIALGGSGLPRRSAMKAGEWSRWDASDIDGRAFLAERAGASESTAPAVRPIELKGKNR